jgi:formylglycine-generating enzyme required for sulfatase activity
MAVLIYFVFFASSGALPEKPPEHQPGPGQPEALPATFTNSLGMEFVLVPKGKSWQGGGSHAPGTEVEIRHDFYLGKYEVTQEEWEKVTGSNPSVFSKVAGVSKEDQNRFPVEQVSWEDAQAFIERLNEKAKETGWVYRLPKEAEWEYACRGGPMREKAEGRFDFYLEKPANQLLPDQANFEHEKGLKRTCQVGSYKPNRLGLCDMHGNVSEMCSDAAGEFQEFRVIRGGAWNTAADSCRVWNRGQTRLQHRSLDLGLRLARVPVGKEIAPEEKKPPVDAKLPKEFKNDLGMEFVRIPKGKSWLGGGSGKPGTNEVEVLHDFYLGKYEVTQEQWQKVMGNNPSHFSRQGNGKDAVRDVLGEKLKLFPVENVSWNDCREFVSRLNEMMKEKGWLYRLPKGAEWEYACRGGPLMDRGDSAYAFYLGKHPQHQVLPAQANFEHGKGVNRTCKVGSYEPNRLGLYDMHGNVWEWCDDEAPADPKAPGVSRRLRRGGSWNDAAERCWASNHVASPPSDRYISLGLRLARVPVGKEIVKLAAEEKKPTPRRVVDLLKLIDTKRDAVQDAWTLGPNGLVSDATMPFCRLKLPYQPPAEYDFKIEFTPKATNDIRQILSAGGHSFTWLMGGYKKWDAFDIIKGHGFNAGGVNIIGGPTSIKPGQRHTSVVEVRKGSIAARIDGKRVVEHKTDFTDLGILAEWKIADGCLGLGTNLNAVEFHKIGVLEVSGPGTALAK